MRASDVVCATALDEKPGTRRGIHRPTVRSSRAAVARKNRQLTCSVVHANVQNSAFRLTLSIGRAMRFSGSPKTYNSTTGTASAAKYASVTRLAPSRVRMNHCVTKLRRIVAPAPSAMMPDVRTRGMLFYHQLEAELPTPQLQERRSRQQSVDGVADRQAGAAQRAREERRERRRHQIVLHILHAEPTLRQLDVAQRQDVVRLPFGAKLRGARPVEIDERIVGQRLHRQNATSGRHDAVQLRIGVLQIQVMQHPGAQACVEGVAWKLGVLAIALKEIGAVDEPGRAHGVARVVNRDFANVDANGERDAGIERAHRLQAVSARIVEKDAALRTPL